MATFGKKLILPVSCAALLLSAIMPAIVRALQLTDPPTITITAQTPPYRLEVLANDTANNLDPADNALTVSFVQSPTAQGGTAEIAPDGKAVLYTPPDGYLGTDTLTYKAKATDGESDAQTIEVEVADDHPIANAGPDQTIRRSYYWWKQNVTLDGSASYDNFGKVVGWTWTGPGLPGTESATPKITLGFRPKVYPSTYTFGLSVRNDSGLVSAVDYVSVTITR
jgi:hypothetical protein